MFRPRLTGDPITGPLGANSDSSVRSRVELSGNVPSWLATVSRNWRNRVTGNVTWGDPKYVCVESRTRLSPCGNTETMSRLIDAVNSLTQVDSPGMPPARAF